MVVFVLWEHEARVRFSALRPDGIFEAGSRRVDNLIT